MLNAARVASALFVSELQVEPAMTAINPAHTPSRTSQHMTDSSSLTALYRADHTAVDDINPTSAAPPDPGVDCAEAAAGGHAIRHTAQSVPCHGLDDACMVAVQQ